MAYSNVTPPALPDLGGGKMAYNGVPLSEIPKLDGYASIVSKFAGSTEYYLFYATYRPYFSGLYLVNSKQSTITKYVLTDGEWVFEYTGVGYENSQFGFPLWGDYDILNKDGTVYLAASDPVPIQSYPYYVLVYDYSEGTEDWYQAHLFASATAFVWDGGKIVNPGGETLRQVYDEETGWLDLGTATPNITPGLDGNVYQRVYTNHDILDAEGNVWLAAGAVTPVEEAKKSPLKSWLMGLALALAGKPRLLAKREPVAWLYNGVRFPLVPERNRKKYPYVFIAKSLILKSYHAIASQEPAVVLNGSFGTIDYEYPWLRLNYDEETGWGNWREMAEDAESSFVADSSGAWTNYDLLKEDGSIWLAASEPIPVYEQRS